MNGPTAPPTAMRTASENGITRRASAQKLRPTMKNQPIPWAKPKIISKRSAPGIAHATSREAYTAECANEQRLTKV
jgi:hypothetical protein